MNIIDKSFFDGYKFRQAMSTSDSFYGEDFYGEDYELRKEWKLEQASNDCQRMWRHLWQKMATALKSR